MIYSTTESLPGAQIETVLGTVTGNIVQSKHVGRDIMANLKSIIGGEIAGYTEMMTEARDIATTRMLKQAESMGADAVIGVRYTTSAIVQGCSEILAFGTAVKLRS